MSFEVTLKDIRRHKPCAEGWTKLLRSLGYVGGRYPSNRKVTLGDVAHSNGPQDALWCYPTMQDTPEARRALISAILPSVKRAAMHATDGRVHQCVDAVDAWLHGKDVDLARAAETAAVVGAKPSMPFMTQFAAKSAAEAAWAADATWAAWASISAYRATAQAIHTMPRAALTQAEYRLQVEDIIAVFGRTSP
jgi:hypothetical protein